MKGIRLFALLLCSVVPGLPALSSEIPEPILRFRDAMYMQESDVDALYRLYRISLADLGDLALPEREQLFWEAQSAFYMARAFQAFDNVETIKVQDAELRRGRFKKVQGLYDRLADIVEYYEKALALAEVYLIEGRDSRGVRLYAESLSQLSTLKTTGYLMANGPKVQKLAQEAIELDPTEVKARILYASRWVYSPKIWGGNPDRGITLMVDALNSGEADREDRFNVEAGIGFAHSMAGRYEDAAEAFRRAEEIYPGNIYARAMLQISEENPE